MSVLIKGMKKPKTCCSIIEGEMELCPFVNTDDDCVLLLGEKCYGTWEEQYADCPLGELPEKHGRLIDADALVPDICHDWEGGRIPPDYYSEECIHNAPTVIEAEGEG